MDTRTLLLTLHITGVAAWLGANFVQLVVNPRFAKDSAAVQAAWTRHQIWLGVRYYNLAGALIAITGVLLVLDGDWSWSSKFVWVGIGVVLLGGALGGAVFAPLTARRLAALEAGDTSLAGDLLRKIMGFAALDSVLILIALLAMADKWKAAF